MKNILVLNPGSTSTKIALYQDETPVWQEEVKYNYEDMKIYSDIFDQKEMRRDSVLEALKKHNTSIDGLDAVVGRGGPAMPFKAGAYRLNDELVSILEDNPSNKHVSLLGGIIAYEIAESIGAPSFIYDAVSVNELDEVAKISGLKGIERESPGHYLNIRASVKKAYDYDEEKINSSNIIVCHLGGGISIALMKHGKIVELISDDEGPMSPERSGGLPLRKLVDLSYSGLEKRVVNKMLRGEGGIASYLGKTNMIEVMDDIEDGDEYSKIVVDAMIYQISNWIGYLTPIVKGKIDSIVLTGGLAYSEYITTNISENVNFISDVICIPGENEMEALALGALRVLNGTEKANEISRG